MRRWIWRILLAALVLSALTVGVLAADPEPWENVPVKDKDFQYEPIDKDGNTVPNLGAGSSDGTVNYSEDDFKKIAAYRVVKFIGTGPNATIPARFNGKPVEIIGKENGTSNDSVFESSNLNGYVKLPHNIRVIGKYAFSGSSLSTIVIPGSVSTIGDYAFYKCTNLREVTFQDYVDRNGNPQPGHTDIGQYAFAKCTQLETLILPNSVKTIRRNAFEECGALENIVFPTSVERLEEGSFNKCEALKCVTFLYPSVTFGDTDGATDMEKVFSLDVIKNSGVVFHGRAATYNRIVNKLNKRYKLSQEEARKYVHEIEIDKTQNGSKVTGWTAGVCSAEDPSNATNGSTNGRIELLFTCKWSKTENQPRKDANGQPIKDENGGILMESVTTYCNCFGNDGKKEATYTQSRDVSASYHNEAPKADKPATCTEDGTKGGTYCTICDVDLEPPTETIPAHHTYAPDDDGVLKPIKEATCQEEGENGLEKHCTVCGKDILESLEDTDPDKVIPKGDHQYYGEDGSPLPGKPETIRAETCTENGIEATYSVCTVCGAKLTCDDCEGFIQEITNANGTDALKTAIEAYTKHLDTQHKTLKIEDGKVYFPATYRELPKAGHTKPASVKSTVIKARTCTEDGLEEWPLYQCTVCKEWVDKESAVIPKLGGEHDWTETETRKEPTCTEEGISVPKCSICGALDETKETDIPALGHEVDETAETTKIIEGEDKTWPATCTKKGQTTLTGVCIRSDELHGDGPRENVTVIKEIEMLPHTPETPVEEIPATCTAPGKKITHPTKCKVCGTVISGEEKEEIIPAKGHTWGDFTPNEGQDMTPNETCVSKTVAGKVKCTVCGAEEERTLTIEGLGKHTWGEWEPSEDGKTETRTCSVCKETETRDVTAPDEPEDDPCKDGHTWGEWILSADGKTETRICEICGETETRPADTTESEKPKSYQISVIPGAGGAASASRSTAQSGDTVTLTVTASSGYELDMIRAIRGGASVVSLTDLGGGQYRFTMPADNVEIRVTFSQRSNNSWSGSNWASAPGEGSGNTDPRRTQDTAPAQITAPAGTPRAGTWGQLYVDLPASHWAAGEINWANQMGYMSGSNGRFNPDGTITVQQVWMVMARLMGTYPANMAEARRWAVETGFATGSDPECAMTRHQVVTALYRCAVLQGRAARPSGLTLAGYADSSLVPTVARDAMIWAVSNGIVTGDSSNRLNPTATITRAQFAVLLYRFSQRV